MLFLTQILFIACSISIDAWIVTLLLKSQNKKLSHQFFVKWSVTLGLTHTLLPAIGQIFCFTFSSIKIIEILSYFTGIIVFLWLLFLSTEDETELKHSNFITLIILTSYDSLAMGFVKTVFIKTWTGGELLFSILSVGLLVGFSVYFMATRVNNSPKKQNFLDNLLKLLAAIWICLNTYELVKLVFTG